MKLAWLQVKLQFWKRRLLKLVFCFFCFYQGVLLNGGDCINSVRNVLIKFKKKKNASSDWYSPGIEGNFPTDYGFRYFGTLNARIDIRKVNEGNAFWEFCSFTHSSSSLLILLVFFFFCKLTSVCHPLCSTKLFFFFSLLFSLPRLLQSLI